MQIWREHLGELTEKGETVVEENVCKKENRTELDKDEKHRRQQRNKTMESAKKN